MRTKQGPGQRVRDQLLRIAALASCLLAASLTSAGEIRAGFTVSVQLLSAESECSLAARTSAVLVDCGTVMVIPVGAPIEASADLQRTGNARSELVPSFDWGGYLQGDGPRNEVVPLELPAGTLRRPDEELQGRKDPVARVQTPTGFSEYSARTVLVGNLEYVEMTVSW
ncbi:MAG TPA: hypothetical protein VLK85_07410 [Ramlibacter sp.]|nr:hypothetical protein [Ramlibacter sp.]